MRRNTIFSALFILLILSTNAHAYLDPGTGSYVLQILLGTLAAGFFAIKHYWVRISTMFSKPKGEEQGQDD